jgi:hypothetical protein
MFLGFIVTAKLFDRQNPLTIDKSFISTTDVKYGIGYLGGTINCRWQGTCDVK